jgi:hypothetical protein
VPGPRGNVQLEGSGEPIADIVYGIDGPVDVIQNPYRMLVEDLARLGKRQFVCRSVQEPLTDLAFEARDLLANPRRRSVHFDCGSNETAFFNDLNERCQGDQITDGAKGTLPSYGSIPRSARRAKEQFSVS